MIVATGLLPVHVYPGLLVSADGAAADDCRTEWDAEIEARIQAIDQGRETGIPFEEVLAAADKLMK